MERRHETLTSRILSEPSSEVESLMRSERATGRLPRLALGLALAVVAAGILLFRGASDPVATSRPATSHAAVSGPPASGSGEGLAAGLVADVTRPFSLVSDRAVLVGQRVYVVEGPTVRDGEPFYLIQHWGDLEHGLRPNSDFGWLPADQALEALRPIAPACPSGPQTLAGIAALQPFERLVCLGRQEVDIGPVTTRLYEVGTTKTWLSSDGSVDFPIAIPYIAAADIAALDRNSWYTVKGHLDDQGCESESDPVARARCRQLFVVTAADAAESPGTFLDGSWRRIADSPLSGRTGSASAWTGTELLIWGGDAFDGTTGMYVADGASYDPVGERWRRLPDAPIGGRVGAFGVWTGTAFLVWGGYERHGDTETQALDGALFDPINDRWQRVPPAPIDMSQEATSAVWTGTELVVFSARMKSGASYDPSSRRWRAIEPSPFDAGESNSPVLVWTGRDLVVLGYPVVDVDTSMAWAAAWNPQANRWLKLPDPGFRSMEGGPAIWTGREILVLWEANRAFDPATGRWRTIKNPCGAVASDVWTGRFTIEYGKAFDVVTEECRNLPLEPERPGGGYREFGVNVWTGRELIRWSGGNGGDGAPRENDGVAFRPDTEIDH